MGVRLVEQTVQGLAWRPFAGGVDRAVLRLTAKDEGHVRTECHRLRQPRNQAHRPIEPAALHSRSIARPVFEELLSVEVRASTIRERHPMHDGQLAGAIPREQGCERRMQPEVAV